jgi:hypothetical protein
MAVTIAQWKTKPWLSYLYILSVPFIVLFYFIAGYQVVSVPDAEWLLCLFFGAFLVIQNIQERLEARHEKLLLRHREQIDCDDVYVVHVMQMRKVRVLSQMTGLAWFKDGLLHFWAPCVEYAIDPIALVNQASSIHSVDQREAYCILKERSILVHLGFNPKGVVIEGRIVKEKSAFPKAFDAWYQVASASSEAAVFPPITRHPSAFLPPLIGIHLLLYSAFMLRGSIAVWHSLQVMLAWRIVWLIAGILMGFIGVLVLGLAVFSMIRLFPLWRRYRGLTETEMIAEISQAGA